MSDVEPLVQEHPHFGLCAVVGDHFVSGRDQLWVFDQLVFLDFLS